MDVSPFRRRRGPLAIFILAAVVLSSATLGVPLVFTSLIGVSAVLAFGCLTLNDAFDVMTPLVIALGTQLGIEPRALVIAVMFGASASFASPIGYQTNTIVHAAGNYRFSDFLKIGLPMNLIVGLVTSFAIYLFYLA